MATIDQLREERIKKLKKLQEAGLLAYPAKTSRTHSIAEALEYFKKIFKNRKIFVLAGRIMAKRGQGGVSFLDINDGSGKIQVLLKKEKIGENGYQFFLDVFDIGDFVEIKGTLFTSKRGEKSIIAEDYKMLSKALFLTRKMAWSFRC